MIIIGEKINTSRKAIAQAVEQKDAGLIQDVARAQAEKRTGISVLAGGNRSVRSKPPPLPGQA